jgi:eukaryotic-like serine/threonine-protein kinase
MSCPACGREIPRAARFCPSCGGAVNLGSSSASSSGERFIPGAVIEERYRIVSKIGAGGMGEVYLAEDLKLGRRVALKVLTDEVTDNVERLRRFEREARAASALNHPNILTVYEIGQSAGAHFIATEFIDGDSLRLRMKCGPMGLSEVLDISIQIASALGAAHAAGIVHRDIKPENIMVRKDDLVKVLDFGLAKLVKQEDSELDPEAATRTLLRTTPGVVLGTTTYMSPEQARGLEVDERTDIWSLGVVLYQLVSGNAPFAGDTTTDVLASILKSEPPPLVHAAEAVPGDLEHVVSKALRKNREERYQNIAEMLVELKLCKEESAFRLKMGSSPRAEASGKLRSSQNFRSDAAELRSTSGSGTTSSAEYMVNEIKRRKFGATTALVVLVSLAALSFLAYWRYSGRSVQGGIDSLAVLPFANGSGDADMEYLSDGLTEDLINNLSQLPRLKVIARSSSFKYKGKDANAEEVARALGVKSILTGRISRHGEDLQISVDLMDARDMTEVWGAQYNRRATDLLAAATITLDGMGNANRRMLVVS